LEEQFSSGLKGKRRFFRFQTGGRGTRKRGSRTSVGCRAIAKKGGRGKKGGRDQIQGKEMASMRERAENKGTNLKEIDQGR